MIRQSRHSELLLIQNVKLIASGGQGGDEKISEAQAICNYILEETDVSMESILLEDKSRTTYENLLFSKEVGEQFVENPCFLFVTNDYHVFRTSTYARKLNMKGDGLGCRTAGYYIPSAFIREYVGPLCQNEMAFPCLLCPAISPHFDSLQRDSLVVRFYLKKT